MTRSFLTGDELTADELNALLDRALELKAAPLSCDVLAGKSVALVFQKPSTRTRISFEVGVSELGGRPLILRTDELQLSRGESLKDFALVISRHVAMVGVRTHDDAELETLAAEGSIPVINMLTRGHHPCQALADLLTLKERFGELEGRKITYVGDGNNVARSLHKLGTLAGAEVVISSPPANTLAGLPNVEEPRAAVAGASAVYTDVWVSMGEDSGDTTALAPYALTDELLDAAGPDVVALHCLPAHPGQEISESVLYGDRQAIWDQAENRRHAQKALLELLAG
ncbi:MAG TPA: ornithine carbamoyltransferase [Baekduia sp.]|nr:ornithine carbamoyltransferase [Baekduia sp.]